MTGQKLPIQIVNKLGNCISYPKTGEIETALADLSIKQSNKLNILPTLPVAEEIILTYFWVDNFHIKVERLCGSGVVNTTHLMAFQGSNIGVTQANVHTSVITLVRKDRRKLSLNHDKKLSTIHKLMLTQSLQSLIPLCRPLGQSLIIQYINFTFFGCFYDGITTLIKSYLHFQVDSLKTVKKFLFINSKKTVETYFPPIASKVYYDRNVPEYLEKSSMSRNMPLVNITLDVGAATFSWGIEM